jgi:hypothetical protein
MRAGAAFRSARCGLRAVVGLAIAICASCYAVAQTPRYIRAKPDAVTKAFGPDIARKIFSDDYTAIRQQAMARSQKMVPGFDCSAGTKIALTDLVPYPVRPGVVSWIETYEVGCKPRATRSFLLLLEDDQIRIGELLPGLTRTDPLLQRDANAAARAVVKVKKPEGCHRAVLTDTSVITAPLGRDPWVERWTFDLCGKSAAVEMRFTPSLRGGTDWYAKLMP